MNSNLSKRSTLDKEASNQMSATFK